ncbi:c-type cytochrome [Acidomonas methanolica]|uniref:c-type cytochrome n=1 Tax=Acidomonas methanolica TaxID=437 RepID=UPI00211A8E58|nr:cytochrome c [Acidomonas methanolica]MCQ9156467.1 cytochrome c [Acidomonas methanolica]
MSWRSFLCRAVLPCAALLCAPLPTQARTHHAAAPGYTAAQAEHGAELYARSCALCHGEDLGGNFQTPPLTGRFVRNWAGTPLSELARYIHDAMPLMAPGTLSSGDVLALIAYLLQENGAKPGKWPLPDQPARLDHLVFPASPAR